MVKVVGTDSKYIHKVSCAYCAAILEYTESETETRYHKDYVGSTDEYRGIVCPKCKHYVILEN